MGLNTDDERARDTAERRTAPQVDRVRSIVRAYVDTPSAAEREIAGIDDLYDESTGLPR
ncbi:hypothetical protein [Janibacter anophelis]|uniref:hypothetical protein n=1 Tax=Janibacter anophelis TaxID=319054 RepID=UPI0013B06416|nr:hypothetical protein [Janibacter anophelis]